MNLGEFLRNHFRNAGIDETEIEALAQSSSLKDIDISDELVGKLNKNVLTREAAMADPDILLNIRKDARRHLYTNDIDPKIEEALQFLTEEDRAQIASEKDTPTKLGMIIPALKKAFDEKAPDSSYKTKIKNLEEMLNKKENEHQEQVKELKSKYEGEKTEILTNFRNEKVNDKVKDKIRGYKLQENLPGGFDYLADATIQDIRNRYKLVLDDDTKDVLLKTEQDGVLTDVFRNNERVTLQKVLEEKLEPFIAKSPKQSQSANGQTEPTTFTPTTQPRTLAEINAAKARQRAAQVLQTMRSE